MCTCLLYSQEHVFSFQSFLGTSHSSVSPFETFGAVPQGVSGSLAHEHICEEEALSVGRVQGRVNRDRPLQYRLAGNHQLGQVTTPLWE